MRMSRGLARVHYSLDNRASLARRRSRPSLAHYYGYRQGIGHIVAHTSRYMYFGRGRLGYKGPVASARRLHDGYCVYIGDYMENVLVRATVRSILVWSRVDFVFVRVGHVFFVGVCVARARRGRLMLMVAGGRR